MPRPSRRQRSRNRSRRSRFTRRCSRGSSTASPSRSAASASTRATAPGVPTRAASSPLPPGCRRRSRRPRLRSPACRPAEPVTGSTDASRPGNRFLDLVEVMDRLRSPGGCPWDAEQTHATLVKYLLEEAYETAEAIEDGDDAALREELG